MAAHPINPEALLNEISGDPRLYLRLIETARHDLPQNLARLEEARQLCDLSAMQQAAHAMRTTLAHWQADRALAMVHRLEIACRESQVDEALGLVDGVHEAIHEVVMAFQKLEER